MSMYTDLLHSAVRELKLKSAATPGEAVAQIMVLRQRMQVGRTSLEGKAARESRDWVFQAVADQLAYDAALMHLAACRGIQSESSRFDPPEQERARLEELLRVTGRFNTQTETADF